MSIETNGLSSGKILDFYKHIEASGGENHGLIIAKNGEKLFEHYIFPYSENQPHTLFSVTKSLISTAVGFAVDEGLITLDTCIAPYFGEYKQSPGTEKITVRHLLTMNSGKKFSFLQDMTGDYVEIFLKAGFRKKPGFLYSNNDVHMLSALLERVTGQSAVDYLMPRLFEPLGIEKPEWERDIKGTCVGGTGCYLKLKDLVTIVQCYADGGMYKGKQVIPEFWAKEATKKQIDIPDTPYSDGYGYLFWINGNDFSMNGMFSQIITYYPSTGMLIGYSSCAVDSTPVMYAAETYLRAADSEPDTADDNKKLEDYLNGKDDKFAVCKGEYPVPDGVYHISPLSALISSLFFPAGLIPRSVSSSMAKQVKKGMNNLSFTPYDGGIQIRWTEDSDTVTVNCGLNGTPGMSECSIKGYKYKIISYGTFEGNTLSLTVRPYNTLATQRMTIVFGGNSVKLSMKDTPQFTEFILHNMTTVPIIEKSKIIKAAAGGVMKLLLKTAYMPMSFRK